MKFNGLHVGLANIARLSEAQTRSITAENVYGEPHQPFPRLGSRDDLEVI